MIPTSMVSFKIFLDESNKLNYSSEHAKYKNITYYQRFFEITGIRVPNPPPHWNFTNKTI